MYCKARHNKVPQHYGRQKVYTTTKPVEYVTELSKYAAWVVNVEEEY